MREFTKSLMSYTFSQSLFGVQQALNMLTPQGGRGEHPATEAFNSTAQCTAEQMGDVMRATYRAGDNIQRGMVDLMFSVLTLGGMGGGGGRGEGWSGSSTGSSGGGGWGSGVGRGAADMGQQTADALRQGMGAAAQTASVVGQAVSGATSGWGRGGGSSQAQDTGWGPMPSSQGNR